MYERVRSGYHLLTHFQFDKCHFRIIQERYPDAMYVKDGILLIKIIRAPLDELWSREPGMVKSNSTMVKSLGKVEGNELGMWTWLPPMGPFQIVDELGTSLAGTTLRFYLRKVRQGEHLKWDFMRKVPTVWANLYGV